MSSELSEAIAPWIAEQSARRQAEWAATKARKTRERADRKAARDAGLVQRYARKQARMQPKPSIT